ncbi:SDR family mycofactocin-dependent oxidoreductase [Arthrobacter pascens]|jgi:SDR family mycofactocin-dependent oxidoreductase|uniref:mycofactocin-coupled SDR family oxidoreductase n=1 Tax=Arthrobacter pascens TaxID=1677 RepID=UPI00285B1CBF|nr:mycofactocin-coupled SDR family oxidoreductase [Arthrobacter pascens]MDR6559882.1 SDR family mycofactocin-dependent oxidoreductase [Arthrobacter pascens]
MAGRFEGKVAFITGAARGQGRSHAVGLASEGANIIAVDACAPINTIPYEGPSAADLEETVRQVEAVGGRIIARQVDVRDLDGLTATVKDGVSEFGRLDIILANAGVVSYGQLAELDEETWQTMIDINLTGVWKTVRAAVPAMIEAGNGGSIILTSSTAGLKALHTLGHYVAAKHGVIGLMRNLANELAPHNIRANALAPTNVDTIMLNNPGVFKMFRPDLENPNAEDAHSGFVQHHLMKVPMIATDDVTNAVKWLASDEARYITGITLPIDLGLLAK